MNDSKVIPAEWEFDSDILVCWPHEATDWSDMLDEIRNCYINLINAFVQAGLRTIILTEDGLLPTQLADIDKSLVIPVKVATNDTWTRDYGPISKVDDHGKVTLVKFQFNGWGLKFAADKDNLVTLKLTENGLLTEHCEYFSDFVLEGGGIESDGKGTIMTTSHCQLAINRNGGRLNPDLSNQLTTYLSAKRILMLHHGYIAGDDTDSHIDTLARFAPGDTIIFVGCDDPDDEHFEELQLMKRELQEFRTDQGLPYNLIELPLPDPIFNEEGQRLPATYANFLATPKALFLPVYGQPKKDFLAEQMLKIAFDMPVYTVDCRAMIKQHGSLHCSTMQIPKIAVRI